MLSQHRLNFEMIEGQPRRRWPPECPKLALTAPSPLSPFSRQPDVRLLLLSFSFFFFSPLNLQIFINYKILNFTFNPTAIKEMNERTNERTNKLAVPDFDKEEFFFLTLPHPTPNTRSYAAIRLILLACPWVRGRRRINGDVIGWKKIQR